MKFKDSNIAYILSRPNMHKYAISYQDFEHWDKDKGIQQSFDTASKWLSDKFKINNNDNILAKAGKGIGNFLVNDLALSTLNDVYKTVKLPFRASLGLVDTLSGKQNWKNYVGQLADSGESALWTLINAASLGAGGSIAKSLGKGALKYIPFSKSRALYKKDLQALAKRNQAIKNLDPTAKNYKNNLNRINSSYFSQLQTPSLRAREFNALSNRAKQKYIQNIDSNYLPKLYSSNISLLNPFNKNLKQNRDLLWKNMNAKDKLSALGYTFGDKVLAPIFYPSIASIGTGLLGWDGLTQSLLNTSDTLYNVVKSPMNLLGNISTKYNNNISLQDLQNKINKYNLTNSDINTFYDYDKNKNIFSLNSSNLSNLAEILAKENMTNYYEELKNLKRVFSDTYNDPKKGFIFFDKLYNHLDPISLPYTPLTNDQRMQQLDVLKRKIQETRQKYKI